MLHAQVLFEHDADLEPHGCSYIRLIQPLSHPVNQPALRVTPTTDYKGGAELVVVERCWKPHATTMADAEALCRQIRRDGARLVYSIDDNLLDHTARSIVQRVLTREAQRVVRYFVREADGVIVSTDRLRDRLRPMNPRVEVVPNALDEQLFSQAAHVVPPSGRPIVIGYMGTFSHDADFSMIVQPLRAVMSRHPGDLRFELVGSIADPTILQAFAGVPVRVWKGYPTSYPEFVRWMSRTLRWDIAIAPLEDTPFTSCKSDIKFLDYTAIGAAGIYSRVAPYEHTVRHLETGWLAENRVDAWNDALEQLLADPGLRRRIAENARTYLWNERTLAQCARRWSDTLNLLLH